MYCCGDNDFLFNSHNFDRLNATLMGFLSIQFAFYLVSSVATKTRNLGQSEEVTGLFKFPLS